MASEISAIVSLPGCFTAAVQCFEHVQLGRNFEKNFQKSLLKLDIAEYRPSRWGERVNIYPNNGNEAEIRIQSAKDVEAAKRFLQEIPTVFTDANRLSDRYKPKTSFELEISQPHVNLPPNALGLHTKIRDLAIRYQKRTNVRKKATWALYHEKYFNRLIEDITQFVNHLDELFPATQEHQQQLQMEVSELSNEPDFASLGEAAEEVDDALREIIEKALETRTGHQYRNVKVSGEAKVENGNYVTTGAVATGMGHIYDGIAASDQAKVRNGDNYGGKNIFDD